MRATNRMLTFTFIVLGLWFGGLAAPAQKPPSLEEQLRAQYDSATVLTVQKQGAIGVGLSSKTCAAKYQDGNLTFPDPACSAVARPWRALEVGEKVNPSKIDVDVAKERISFAVTGCDSCNKGAPASPYKSQIDFQFAKGYLEKAGVSQIVDTISEVLAFPDMAQEAPPQPAAQPEQAAQPDGTLTNNDIIKMARVKLGDSIIIAKIKASPCNFDTSVDALVKLKEAGVSDAVIQAMQDASAPQATGGDSTGAPPNPTPAGPSTFPVRHRHRSYDVQNWKAVDSYCSGSLSVFPDGKVAYDCSQADDQGNRCEHVSFAAGALKQAKIGSGGSLHIESKTQGKFDFFGDQNDIQQALAAIAPLVQTTQK